MQRKRQFTNFRHAKPHGQKWFIGGCDTDQGLELIVRPLQRPPAGECTTPNKGGRGDGGGGGSPDGSVKALLDGA